LQEGDTAGAVRIVLDPEHRCFNAALGALEIDNAITLLVATPAVTAGEPALVVAAARLALCDG
jgi:hypothetical protein